MWDMTHSCVWHDSFIRVTWLVHTCDIDPMQCSISSRCIIYVTHMNESCLMCEWVMLYIRMSHVTHIFRVKCIVPRSMSYAGDHSFICATWRIHMCDMTQSYVQHVSFTCATWFVKTCDMTHVSVQHDSFIRVTWLIRMCNMNVMWDMIYLYMQRDSCIYMTLRIDICDMLHLSFLCVTCIMHMHITHHDSFIR